MAPPATAAKIAVSREQVLEAEELHRALLRRASFARAIGGQLAHQQGILEMHEKESQTLNPVRRIAGEPEIHRKFSEAQRLLIGDLRSIAEREYPVARSAESSLGYAAIARRRGDFTEYVRNLNAAAAVFEHADGPRESVRALHQHASRTAPIEQEMQALGGSYATARDTLDAFRQLLLAYVTIRAGGKVAASARTAGVRPLPVAARGMSAGLAAGGTAAVTSRAAEAVVEGDTRPLTDGLKKDGVTVISSAAGVGTATGASAALATKLPRAAATVAGGAAAFTTVSAERALSWVDAHNTFHRENVALPPPQRAARYEAFMKERGFDTESLCRTAGTALVLGMVAGHIGQRFEHLRRFAHSEAAESTLRRAEYLTDGALALLGTYVQQGPNGVTPRDLLLALSSVALGATARPARQPKASPVPIESSLKPRAIEAEGVYRPIATTERAKRIGVFEQRYPDKRDNSLNPRNLPETDAGLAPIPEPETLFFFDTKAKRFIDVEVYLPKPAGRPNELMCVRLNGEHPVTGQLVGRDMGTGQHYLLEPQFIEQHNPGFLQGKFRRPTGQVISDRDAEVGFVFRDLNPDDHITLRQDGKSEQFRYYARLKDQNIVALADSRNRIVFVTEDELRSSRLPPTDAEQQHNSRNASAKSRDLASEALKSSLSEALHAAGDVKRLAQAFVETGGRLRLARVNGRWETVLYPGASLGHDPRQPDDQTYFGEKNKYTHEYRALKEQSLRNGKGVPVVGQDYPPHIHVSGEGIWMLEHNRIIGATEAGVPIVVRLSTDRTWN